MFFFTVSFYLLCVSSIICLSTPPSHRRAGLERELKSQLSLLDYINTLTSDTGKKLQELENQAETAMAEAESVVEHMGARAANSYSSRNASEVVALTERLQVGILLDDESGLIRFGLPTHVCPF